MAGRSTETEAIVMRTLKYGESDLIAHLFTRESGRRNVIAKGARRSRSRLGARLDPFLVLRLQLREGRGELAIVAGVEVIASHERVRSSYRLQQAGAAALDMLNRLSVEHAANEPAFHLAAKLLHLLEVADDAALAALVTGFELKLLHLNGLAPHLGSCTRCGSAGPLEGWAPADGGVVCRSCRTPADVRLDADAYEAATLAIQSPLAELAQLGDDSGPSMRAAHRQFVEQMCTEHAGFRPRAL